MEKKPIAAIFLTVLIDMLGVGIIIPVLPALFMSHDTSILDPLTPTSTRSIMYGFLTATYPFFQFFGAPILGALSDRYGRKPLLQLSLLGTMIGYLLFAYAIYTKNLPLLFISRALPGFTGGNISIIYSALADIVEPASRPKYFGLVGMAFGLGFILGPAIGGILADNTVVSWFDHATPFWFTAILTLINLLLVQVSFRETLGVVQARAVQFSSGIKNIRRAFSSPNLKGIFTVSLLISLGFSFFTQFFSVYLIQKFQMTEKSIGLLFGWIGLWLVFTQGFIVRRLAARFQPLEILRYSLFFMAISVLCVLIPQNQFWIYFVNPFIAIFQGMSGPNMTTAVSVYAGEKEQGEILGINQSMISVGQIFPPIAAGYLNSLDGRLPILASVFFIFLGWIAFISLKKKQA